MRNKIVINQLISLHKPNKKLRSEKIMMYLRATPKERVN
jgi:hypothetical protein